MRFRLAAALLAFHLGQAGATDQCLQYVRAVRREAQAVFGVDAPVPTLMGQLRQESRCRADVTARDNGRGLAQFMDATAALVARSFPELGAPDPYNATWAIRAMVRYDSWLRDRVQFVTACDAWGATLSAYNGGLGYVQQSQRASTAPGVWFGVTERVRSRQTASNFAFARSYPRKIILTHQPLFRGTGTYICEGPKP